MQRLPSAFRRLLLTGLATAFVYFLIAAQSVHFDFHAPLKSRPIGLVLLLFGCAFALYLYAVRLCERLPPSRSLLVTIVGGAILFRVVLLPSTPIQEQDIYRYLWDGAVGATGVSPFRYSPHQVLNAVGGAEADLPLRAVASLAEDPALLEILRRVHFGELPTIYPTTSQLVFTIVAAICPEGASVEERLTFLKASLVAFDVATIVVVILILNRSGVRSSRCVVYAWCPLLVKEVANSGHLDAIAVIFAALAVYLLLLAINGVNGRNGWRVTLRGSAAFGALALAVGAKLYPVVLAPLFLLALWRTGASRAVCVGFPLFVLASVALLWPLIPDSAAGRHDATSPSQPDASMVEETKVDPSLGLATFLRRWEMNDFIFLIVVENLKPRDLVTSEGRPWFSVVPETVRRWIVQSAGMLFGREYSETPFFLARLLTGVAFAAVSIWLLCRVRNEMAAEELCEAAFLTLAWFWLLCPTQNPWYWTWTLPFLPFARGRAWLLMSGLVFLYYGRFWLRYHFEDVVVPGSGYAGVDFFDFVVTWIEYGPWFVLLAADAMRRKSMERVTMDGTKRRSWLS